MRLEVQEALKPDSDLGRVCTLAEAEREHFSEVVEMTNGVIAGKGGAAEALGVPPSTSDLLAGLVTGITAAKSFDA